MYRRLPWWVASVTFVLAASAGCVNVVALHHVAGVAVAHHSGTSAGVAVAVAEGDGARAALLVGVVLAFMAGAAISGATVQATRFTLGRRYGVLLLAQAALIGAALAVDGVTAVAVLLAVSSGMQNAMATSYSGAIVRTTHVTGVITDLGILAGHRAMGLEVPPRKVGLLLAILGGYVGGTAAGALAVPSAGMGVLWGPLAVHAGAGVAYLLWRGAAGRAEG